jgi:hypothetical protein
MNWMSDMLFNPAPSSARTERARRNSDSSTNLAAQAVGEEEVMSVCFFVFFLLYDVIYSSKNILVVVFF